MKTKPTAQDLIFRAQRLLAQIEREILDGHTAAAIESAKALQSVSYGLYNLTSRSKQ